MLEKYAFYAIVLGLFLGVVGYLWLVVRAFRHSIKWGLATLFPPLGLLFLTRYFSKAKAPAYVLLLAVLLIGTPYAASYYERHFVPLQPYEQFVDGERRITLTGLKNFDYAVLRAKPDVVVLQMANQDVDDLALENLRGMDRLAELDLNGTQITDAGLAVVAELPGLKRLRLARTKITDEGFRKHLSPKESLVNLDLTSTAVKGPTKRNWRKEKPGREYVD